MTLSRRGSWLSGGIDTNEVSVDGLSSVAQTTSYEMTIAGVQSRLAQPDIKGPTSADVAEAMIDKFRADAPIAQIVGDPATPQVGDEVHLNFEGQTYVVAINDDREAIVSGGEAGRLTAFFDAQDRLHVVSQVVRIGKSKIEVLVDNDIPDNVDVARRLGLMDGLTQVKHVIRMKVLSSREQALLARTM